MFISNKLYCMVDSGHHLGVGNNGKIEQAIVQLTAGGRVEVATMKLQAALACIRSLTINYPLLK